MPCSSNSGKTTGKGELHGRSTAQCAEWCLRMILSLHLRPNYENARSMMIEKGQILRSPRNRGAPQQRLVRMLKLRQRQMSRLRPQARTGSGLLPVPLACREETISVASLSRPVRRRGCWRARHSTHPTLRMIQVWNRPYRSGVIFLEEKSGRRRPNRKIIASLSRTARHQVTEMQHQSPGREGAARKTSQSL